MLDKCGEAPDTVIMCTKDIGDKNRLQKLTRGIWVHASGGGHIQMWQPLAISVSLFKHNLHVYT